MCTCTAFWSDKDIMDKNSSMLKSCYLSSGSTYTPPFASRLASTSLNSIHSCSLAAGFPSEISRCSTLTRSGSTIVSSRNAAICSSISSLPAHDIKKATPTRINADFHIVVITLIVQCMEHKHRVVIFRYGGKILESVFFPLFLRPCRIYR